MIVPRLKNAIRATICASSIFAFTQFASAATPTLTFSPALTQIPVMQGTSATDAFTFTTGGGFTGSVSLALTGLPSGVTYSWSQNPVSISSNAGASQLKLTASSTAVVNWFTFTVTATGDGLTVTRNYTVEVGQAPGFNMSVVNTTVSLTSLGSTTETVTMTPFGGATVAAGAPGAKAAIVSGLPSGVTAAWSAPTVSSKSAVTWILTLTGSTLALGSTGTLTLSTQVTDSANGLSYSANEGVTLKVVFVPPTMSFGAVITHLPVIQGKSATDVFNFTTGGSFHGGITLSITGLPSGVSASWSSNPVTTTSGKGASTLQLSASPTATVNWFTFNVTAAGDGLSTTWAYTVEVEPSTGVKIELAQPALTILPSQSTTLLVTAQPVNGILLAAGAPGALPTIVSGLPSGFTSSWSAPTVTSAGAVNWTLTLGAPSSALTGSNSLGLSVKIVDKTSGTAYSASQSIPLLVSLLGNLSIGSTPGVSISPTFMGFSHEWGDAQSMLGSNATGVNSIYRQLLTNLTAYGSGPINIRIGGSSSDLSGTPTSTTAAPFAQLFQATGSQFELGVNLGSNNVSLAVNQAKAYVSQMPAGSLDAIEIGNEPDLYVNKGYRSSDYTVQDYFSDFASWRASILAVEPSTTKFIGPAWAFTATLTNLPSFESAESGYLSASSQHFYATSSLDNPADDFLLTPAASTKGAAAVAAGVANAHASGNLFRMGELNSVSVEGIPGFSNSFSASLWSIDTMFQFASVGVDGVNWATPEGDPDSPFAFSTTTSAGKTTYSLTSVTPLYYGLLLFQEATGNGAKLLPVTLNTPANLTAWATVDASGTPRLVIINKDEEASGSVGISLPGYSQATYERLIAPSFTSISGVTLGGQTFDGSSNGKILGTATSTTVDGNNGFFEISLPTTSAVIVVFSK